MKKIYLTLILICTNLQAQINIYSHRHYDSDKILFKKFTDQTGIKINVIKGSADQLIERLISEGGNSPADILFTVDAGRLHRAKVAGILQPIESKGESISLFKRESNPGSIINV